MLLFRCGTTSLDRRTSTALSSCGATSLRHRSCPNQTRTGSGGEVAIAVAEEDAAVMAVADGTSAGSADLA